MRCEICPRRCNAERTAEKAGGVCRMPAGLVVARAMLHLWEEPVLSGKNGAGCIFFSGCNLGCVFCQNGRISHENFGKVITPAHLREIVETLRTLEGKVQIYLPDLKYAMERPARELSAAPDYFEAAAAAIDEMVRQVGAYQIGDDGLMRSGVILRHLVLPGQMENTKRVIDYVSTHFPPKTVLFSLMSQYTPQPGSTGALARRLNEREYRTAVQYMRDCGLTDGFCQELSSAKEEYTPVFDLQGV